MTVGEGSVSEYLDRLIEAGMNIHYHLFYRLCTLYYIQNVF
jgi:hypothetical protein